jgi:hypothetical protein
MSVLAQNFVATAQARAGVLYTYNDLDDMKSLRRWVQRWLSPETDETHDPDEANPFVYLEPLTGTFKRPAVTIRLLPTTGLVTQRDPSSNYAVVHQFVLTAYHEDHDKSLALGERLWRGFWEGGDPALARHRVPMWAFGLNARLSRFMRILPETMSQDLAETNEQGVWSRALNVSIRAPRFRQAPSVPTVRSIGVRGRAN